MASESRALRPFDDMSRTQVLMREVVKIASSDPKKGAAIANQRLSLTYDEYLESGIVLWLGRHSEDHRLLAQTIHEEIQELYQRIPGAVHLVVSVTNKRLKMTDLLLDHPIESAADVPMRIDLHTSGPGGSRPRPLQTPGDGCEILVEFLVGSDLNRSTIGADRAWRKGSWLARVSIGIACSTDFSGPRPLPLTPAVREQFDVPEGALHYCRVLATEEALLYATNLDDVLEYYVDSVILESATQSPTAPWSQRLQLGWILDAIKTFVFTARMSPLFDGFDLTSSPGDGSVLRAIVDKVAENTTPESVVEAFELLVEEPSRFFAELEDRAGLVGIQRELVQYEEGVE